MQNISDLLIILNDYLPIEDLPIRILLVHGQKGVSITVATLVDEDAGRVGELSATDLLDLHSQLLAADVGKLLHLKVPPAEDLLHLLGV